jgi:hypothetical protein
MIKGEIFKCPDTAYFICFLVDGLIVLIFTENDLIKGEYYVFSCGA